MSIASSGNLSQDFDLFVGIDWTGAQPARGVAVAACDAGGLVSMVRSAGRHWQRAEAMGWLAGQVESGRRVLAGIDCGFSLPWVPGVGYLDGRVPAAATLFDLWQLVEDASAGAPDDFAGPAVWHPLLAPSFWINGPTPAHWGDGRTKRRRTEVVAAETGAGTPVSVFKLAAAAKQVGKASLAGMRSLLRLKRRLGDRIAIWPAEAPVGTDGRPRSVVCEIYPTLFRKQALASVRKVTAGTVLAPALVRYGARLAADVPELFDDHLGDALISAAGLRVLARHTSAWNPPALDGETACREGWIFGVGA
ncbi:hypothetical protein [Oleisolibacter albus]|uniref:hypothetical protein n=1 Tax=Oleisolibacter albus TaxID=2171757 RepID=UPI000DF21543|nr:hypothetical protein [Oleisolibacter albus]